MFCLKASNYDKLLTIRYLGCITVTRSNSYEMVVKEEEEEMMRCNYGIFL